MTNRNVRAMKAKYNLTNQSLAEELKMSTSTFSERLTGKQEWALHQAKQLVDIFNSHGENYTIESLFEL